MTKRRAKKEACFRSALVLRNALGQGWLLDEDERIATGVREIIAELERRASLQPSEGEERP